MKISMIVAMTPNRVIGKNGKMPWNLDGARSDLRRFRQITGSAPIIMGWYTFDSLETKPLPGRENIVITKGHGGDVDRAGGIPAESPEHAMMIAGSVPELFIIGGESVYKAFFPQAHYIHLTVVYVDADGDTYFPPIDETAWEKVLWDVAPRQLGTDWYKTSYTQWCRIGTEAPLK